MLYPLGLLEPSSPLSALGLLRIRGGRRAFPSVALVFLRVALPTRSTEASSLCWSWTDMSDSKDGEQPFFSGLFNSGDGRSSRSKNSGLVHRAEVNAAY
mmetsp:Transcript_5429/g.21493  ORF Transcript_5429/g.21493 Transcript_5429/m.21493 type:complete len:99 (+) Transcript_5429:125-421(+)